MARLLLGGMISLFLGFRLWGAGPLPSQSLQKDFHLLNEQGLDHYRQAEYKKSAESFRQALNHFTGEDLDYAQVLHNLATSEFYLGLYESSESLFLRVITIRAEKLGPKHLDTIQTLNNLAILYLFDRQYSKAQPLFEEVLDARRKELGDEHAETAIAYHNLAELYRKLRKWDDSQGLHQKALTIRKKIYAADKPEDLASSLYNLGELHRDQNLNEQAAIYYREVIAVLKESLGEDSEHLYIRLARKHL